jgi:pyrimidine-nucleoside phosphorylase
MNSRETTDLTLSMLNSGDQIDLSPISGLKVDKHSTGGVADTTTLIAAPLVASCGGKVAKMSGRGLGHTGGTLDKLESIPGFSVSLTMNQFFSIVSQIGLSVIGQTANLVPADKKLYALRDVTGTIDNISLIASSIMSKKLASGSDAIVLDVKTGNGAFMEKEKDAIILAQAMVDIGKLAGKPTIALVTDMNQPLGMAIGNSIEVEEAILILKGEAGGDLKEVSTALAVQMLLASKIYNDEKEASKAIKKSIEQGTGLEYLQKMIKAQGGNPKVIENTTLLPQANEKIPIIADKNGFLNRIITHEVGISALLLGAGRSKKEENIDPSVGIWMKKRLGDPIEKGEEIAVFHVNNKKNLEEAITRFNNSLTITEKKGKIPPLIYRKID